jgi:hypothetical protein
VLFPQRDQVPAAGQNSEISGRDYRPAFTACSDFQFSSTSSGSDPNRHIYTTYLFTAIATKPRASHLITAFSFTRPVSFFKSSFPLTGVCASLLGHQPEDQL